MNKTILNVQAVTLFDALGGMWSNQTAECDGCNAHGMPAALFARGIDFGASAPASLSGELK